jgi:hypothetical protein
MQITQRKMVMKSTSLFQLGGIAVLLSAILTGIGRLIYFLSGQPDLPFTPDLWRGIVAGALMVLGVGALFARQSQQGGLLGLIGYVFIVSANIYFVASDAIGLGVAAGVISYEEIAQIPSYALADSILPWVWVAGLLAFGTSIYRAQVFPKYAGLLLLLVGLIQPLAGLLAFTRPIYAVCYVVAWTWLGWELYAKAGMQKDEQQPARRGATAKALR